MLCHRQPFGYAAGRQWKVPVGLALAGMIIILLSELASFLSTALLGFQATHYRVCPNLKQPPADAVPALATP
jgi:hypothetical protein